MIADKIVHSGNTNGTSVWLDWMPETVGEHTLYAKVVKDHDDPRQDNGIDTLTVRVVDARDRFIFHFPFLPFMSNAQR